ncbi:hypothetical protein AGMMS49525_15320 [Bacteroidia bacterium]|nr:hypothetical protein AGMMS49525_15320 [Bacteroidia bacterium]
MGAFTGSTPEYGTVAEIATSPTDATYLYVTVAEVDYLTNDTVNKRQVVFRLHDPADKAIGIVFEVGKQYTFLLTLGLNSEEIVFSIPAVTDFNPLAEVEVPPIVAPFKCGDLIKTYTTANYGNTPIKDLCWTTQNIKEGTASFDTYVDASLSSAPTAGERGFYYTVSEADAACKLLGAGWSVPTYAQWTALDGEFDALMGGVGTSGTPQQLQTPWTTPAALAGLYKTSPGWLGWDQYGLWLAAAPNMAMSMYDASYTIFGDPSAHNVEGTDAGDAVPLRCVRTI